ncbi:MAG: tRNA adenosine(34) deaminase TadA [Acutalibacteraceae bacterium]|nr:tRNA adenosine(34) deaminase TadA [Acutalibacteraceae bacterium]
MESVEFYMNEALKLAEKAFEEGEVPVGAVVVHNGEIIGKGYNLRKQSQNAMLHAESVAIYNACEKLGSWRLWECDLYVTLEPCPMCTGAIINSRICNVYYGAKNLRAGGCGSIVNLFDYPFNHKANIISGVLEDECGAIMTRFFEKIRNHRKQEKEIQKALQEKQDTLNTDEFSEGDIKMETEFLNVNGKAYRIIKLLGKGKGGYSYLATDEKEEQLYTLKQIHHEPCDYYQFGNKIEAEIRDYEKLKNIGITMPLMLEVDIEKECILKEYIEGETIYNMVLQDKMKESYFEQIKGMCKLLYANNTNIDYFPTNFIVQNEKLFYIDFECNDYMEEWNFENWGIKYWAKTPEFLKYVEENPN